MLKRKNRLKKKKDFEKVFKKGKRIKEDFLFFKYVPGPSGAFRCGVVVSQKVSKKAVVRNKIKRRIKSIVLQKMREAKTGGDFVFVVLPGSENKTFREIKETVNRIFKRARILESPKSDT